MTPAVKVYPDGREVLLKTTAGLREYRKRIEKMGANRGGTDFYRKLKQLGFPSGYRVLCHNCNQAIGFYRRCPHASVL